MPILAIVVYRVAATSTASPPSRQQQQQHDGVAGAQHCGGAGRCSSPSWREYETLVDEWFTDHVSGGGGGGGANDDDEDRSNERRVRPAHLTSETLYPLVKVFTQFSRDVSGGELRRLVFRGDVAQQPALSLDAALGPTAGAAGASAPLAGEAGEESTFATSPSASFSSSSSSSYGMFASPALANAAAQYRRRQWRRQVQRSMGNVPAVSASSSSSSVPQHHHRHAFWSYLQGDATASAGDRNSSKLLRHGDLAVSFQCRRSGGRHGTDDDDDRGGCSLLVAVVDDDDAARRSAALAARVTALLHERHVDVDGGAAVGTELRARIRLMAEGVNKRTGRRAHHANAASCPGPVVPTADNVAADARASCEHMSRSL